ncbi:hypothetical protein ABR738_25485 [Streptomyces sp. Edi4]|uniref:hypothetical protein n=1 Tax=Streptomyces sp. Edi4 TaxID=3162527 RepID=UPI003305A8F5
MGAIAVDHSGSGDEWDDVLRTWEGTDAPEGRKVEILDGVITVAPMPSGGHVDAVLLDPWHSDRPAPTLYRAPEHGTYRVLDIVEYGAKLTLPAPFDLEVDTGEFPVL